LFLGFAVADADDFSIPASVLAIAAFLAGAWWRPDRLKRGHHRARLLAIATYLQIALVGAALVVSMVGALYSTHSLRCSPLATGFAERHRAPARRAGLTTTVLTLTLTGLAATQRWRAENPHPGRRLLATATMFWALPSRLFSFFMSVSSRLALALALLVANASRATDSALRRKHGGGA